MHKRILMTALIYASTIFVVGLMPLRAEDLASPCGSDASLGDSSLTAACSTRRSEVKLPEEGQPLKAEGTVSAAVEKTNQILESAPLTPEQADSLFDNADRRNQTSSKSDDARDPLVKLNEPIFKFNYNADRYILKPVAKGYRAVLTDKGVTAVGNFLDNVGFVPKTINSVFQGKPLQAGQVVARFLINSTIGIAGFGDAANYFFHLEPVDATFSQTLAKLGVPPGPYLVPPLLPSTTARGAAGQIVDIVLDPVNIFAPGVVTLGRGLTKAVNDRAANLDTYDSVESSTLDLYTADRNAKLAQADQEASK